MVLEDAANGSARIQSVAAQHRVEKLIWRGIRYSCAFLGPREMGLAKDGQVRI